MSLFNLKSEFKPTGDQPRAIEKITEGLKNGLRNQVLLGVTGSGKTFTMANVIANIAKPTLVISHNKTLAAQLAQEYRDFFPNNAVEYFVSYYDYYQPESYIPQRDMYIEKEADINQEIDRLRLSATASLLQRKDVIVVASVSCIYNLGSPEEYGNAVIEISTNNKDSSVKRDSFIERLVDLFYVRSDYDFVRSSFRVRGNYIDIWPSYSNDALRISFLESGGVSTVESISPLTGTVISKLSNMQLYPAKHYITSKGVYDKALSQISIDLDLRVNELKRLGKELEAHRIKQRTEYDLEMIREVGYCNGIENYSRYFDSRNPGDPPFTLLDYFPKDYLLVIDESHITVPQIRGMYNGDRSRKNTLIEYGFRLPSAADNRPLKFDEFVRRINQVVYTSATPAEYEMSLSRIAVGNNTGIIEQLIRPTGLLDPEVEVRKAEGQIENLTLEINKRVKNHERVLVTTLTKRLAEEITTYLAEKGIKVQYLHSDVETLERTDILDNLRQGKYDVIVGINLLREGLDLPEVSLVAILDADKEGFLRSDVSLIQTMGRAARHVNGKVVLFADNMTGSMQRAISEVTRRRKLQEEYNRSHGIVPKSIQKPFRARLIEKAEDDKDTKLKSVSVKDFQNIPEIERVNYIKELEGRMKDSADILDFELAAYFRDQIRNLKKYI